jgi:hypothetical protein
VKPHHRAFNSSSSEAAGELSSQADGLVQAAILSKSFSQDGVEYLPFRVKSFSFQDSFTNIWAGGVLFGNMISFYQYSGSNGEYCPLGDVAATGPFPEAIPPLGVLLFAPASGHPQALAHPVDFQWILDDHGSGNDRDVSYWRLVPPEGYTAVGIAFGAGKPNVNNYWCVKNQHCVPAGRRGFWSDQGAGWEHNGDLTAPTLPGVPTDGSMYLVPPTVVSDEGGDPTWVLKAKMALLDLEAFDCPAPVYDPNVESGQETTRGLQKPVVIVPYTAVPADQAFPNQALTSPFYFVACEPFWHCDTTLSTPQGGYEQVTQTVGVTDAYSQTFSQETSFTIDCNVGLQFGDAAGSLGASASLTQSFTLTTETSKSSSSENQTTQNVNFPNSNLVAVWSRQKHIKVFRTDASQVSSAPYSTKDQRLISAPSALG